jgi:hypothetical protein
VNASPAIASVVDRGGPAFRSTPKSTLPLPVPVAPAVIRNHGAAGSDVAVHAQPAGAMTSTEAAPPAAGMFAEPLDSANVQPAD